MPIIEITCYVTRDGELMTYNTAERIRLATPAERRESFEREREPQGAMLARVSTRTLRQRCRELMAMRSRMDHGWS